MMKDAAASESSDVLDADSSGVETKINSNNNNNEDGLSEYEKIRLMRIQRNQARLQALGLLDMAPPTTKKNHHKRKSPKKTPPIDVRHQPKRKVKDLFVAQQVESKIKVRKGFHLAAIMPESGQVIHVKMMEPTEQCFVCHETCRPGEFLHCLACDGVSHWQCLDLESKPRGRWKCQACQEAKRPILEQYSNRKKKKKVALPPRVTLPKKTKMDLFEGEHDDGKLECQSGVLADF